MLDKEPRNEKGQAHGLWDFYCGMNNRYVVHCINNVMSGYAYMYYALSGDVKKKYYYAR
jgi:hypothetical protein